MNRDEQIRVEDHRDYTKNPVRGSVVNTNTSVFVARRKQIRLALEKERRLLALEKDSRDIKSILKQILDKLDGNNNRNA